MLQLLQLVGNNRHSLGVCERINQLGGPRPIVGGSGRPQQTPVDLGLAVVRPHVGDVINQTDRHLSVRAQAPTCQEEEVS